MLRIQVDPVTKHEYAIFLHITENALKLNGTTYTLDEIKSLPDFRPFSRFMFPLNVLADQNKLRLSEGDEKTYPILHPCPPFERYAYTATTKSTKFSTMHLMACLVGVTFYPHTKNFKDALTIVIAPDIDGLMHITTEDETGQVVPYAPESVKTFLTNEHQLPKCELTSDTDVLTAKGVTFTFVYKDMHGEPQECDFVATAKSDTGYIAHSKFNVVAGKGSFKFLPLGLSAGETVNIQVGIGKYSDMVSKTVTVK